jgi:hypothetical protein
VGTEGRAAWGVESTDPDSARTTVLYTTEQEATAHAAALMERYDGDWIAVRYPVRLRFVGAETEVSAEHEWPTS